MSKYWKSILMVVATVLAAVLPALTGDNTIDATEWVNVAIIAVGACAVFTAPNVPFASYTKTILAVLTAILTVLASVLVGGVSQAEIIQIVLAGLGAIGVYAKANTLGPRTSKAR